ncbi:uncharacterized protein METZ01_LOCUS265220, partial [marine metagenome]
MGRGLVLVSNSQRRTNFYTMKGHALWIIRHMAVPLPATLHLVSLNWFLHGQRRTSSPQAAFSHCASEDNLNLVTC